MSTTDCLTSAVGLWDTKRVIREAFGGAGLPASEELVRCGGAPE